MKTIAITIAILFISLMGFSQLSMDNKLLHYKPTKEKSIIVEKPQKQKINMFLSGSDEKRGASVGMTVGYLAFTSILSISYFSQPENVRKQSQVSYAGLLIGGTVTYIIIISVD